MLIQKKKFLSQYFFQFLIIFTFTSRIIWLIPISLFVSLIVIFNKYSYFNYTLNIEKKIFLFYLISILTGGYYNLFFSPVNILHVSTAIISIFTAFIFSRSTQFYYLASKYALVTFQVFILSFIFFTGFDNFPAIVPLEKLVKDSSANGITSYTVLLQLNYTIISFFLHRKLTFITAFATLLIASVSYGRGSIFSSVMILLLLFLTFVFSMKPKNILILGMLFIFFIITLLGLYSDEIYLFLEANTKLSAGVVDIQRSQIINEYFEKMDLKGFFFGVDYFGTSILYEFNSNPHNSFIRAHHIFGFPYLLFILISPFYFIFNIKRTVKEVFFYFFSIIILFFRIFSEPILFPTLFDFYFFSIIFFLAKKNVDNKNLIQFSNGQ